MTLPGHIQLKTGTKPDRRKPITESLLFKLIINIPKLGLSAYDSSLFNAMFLIAFYFLFKDMGNSTILSQLLLRSGVITKHIVF